jgi:hypothetical protein
LQEVSTLLHEPSSKSSTLEKNVVDQATLQGLIHETVQKLNENPSQSLCDELIKLS